MADLDHLCAPHMAPPGPSPQVSVRCPACMGSVEVWTCQDCGRTFEEDATGKLVVVRTFVDGPACRACGCTEDAACEDLFSGGACAWATPDLCTACVGIVQRVFTPGELTFLLHAAGGGDLNLTRPDATALTAEGVLALRETLRVIAPKPEGDDR